MGHPTRFVSTSSLRRKDILIGVILSYPVSLGIAYEYLRSRRQIQMLQEVRFGVGPVRTFGQIGVARQNVIV
jgi:hypothetical protein